MTSSKTPAPAFGFFVALVTDGIPKFSESPVRHPTKLAAKAEAERLAGKYPGKLFQVFGASMQQKAGISTPSSIKDFELATAYKAPQPTVFSGHDLLHKVPAGVYRLAAGPSSSTVRFVVLTNGLYRAALFCVPGDASPMSPTAWRDDRFVRTSESAMEVLAR